MKNCQPFWPYCGEKVKKDLSSLRKSKTVKLILFLVIAVVLVIVEERRLAYLSLSAVSIQSVRLLGEIFADRIMGDGFLSSLFKGGE